MEQLQNILITGASSGLGAALAKTYAKTGITLFLSGRDKDRLNAVAQICRDQGAEVNIAVLDVLDKIAMRSWIDQIKDLDLVIANAGVSGGTGGVSEPEDQTRHIFAINLDGVMNTVFPAVDNMKKHGRGQIAIISSLAGFRGFPGAPAYCASKAAVRVWGEGLRGDLHKHGIKVNVVCPGYVRTPMTDVNDFPMPGLMAADKAANIIKEGLQKNKPRIAFPLSVYMMVWWLTNLPARAVDWLLRQLPTKKGLD